jgi:hypothetical protein
MNNHRALFVGPMSKNLVDALITSDLMKKVGLIPSRRQIDTNPPGYVNNWSTIEFLEYTNVKNAVRCRDHAGPMQGSNDDDGLDSLRHDVSHDSFFEIVHVDPWKSIKDVAQAAEATAKIIDYCYEQNDNVLFEIGTEQGIRLYDPKEFEKFIMLVQKKSGKSFKNVIYAVIQGGTLLKDTHNAGHFDESKCFQMIQICRNFGLFSKEHNGDYLTADDITKRFALGLDSINIAPEFGNIETNVILEHLDLSGFERFYDICFKSKKWAKWLPKDFQVKSKDDQRKLIEVSGHYVFSQNDFKDLKCSYNVSDDVIKAKHVQRIDQILGSITKVLKIENSIE